MGEKRFWFEGKTRAGLHYKITALDSSFRRKSDSSRLVCSRMDASNLNFLLPNKVTNESWRKLFHESTAGQVLSKESVQLKDS